MGILFVAIFNSNEWNLNPYQLEYWRTLINGVDVLLLNSRVIIVSILMLSASFILSIFLISFSDSKYFGEDTRRVKLLDVVSLGISGIPIILAIICFISFRIGISMMLILLASILILYFLVNDFPYSLNILLQTQFTQNHLFAFIIFTILIIFFLFLKFGYIAGLEFPLNIDSVVHTYYIKRVILAKNQLDFPYYHFGFHYVIIMISRLTSENVEKVTLLFGQLLQTIVPLSIYYPVHRITNNNKAAFMSVFVAGGVSSMPAIVTSWGKYPALMAVSCIIFVFHFIFISFEKNNKKFYTFFIAGLVAITGIFIHSRVLIVIFFGLLSSIMYHFISKKSKLQGILIIFVFLVTIFIVSRFGIRSNKWDLELFPFKEKRLLLGVLILLLPISTLYFPKYIIQISIFSIFLILGVAIPLPQMLTDYYDTRTLIDRPFLSIFLLLPFSLFFGLGIAGLENVLKKFWRYNLTNVFIPIFVTFFLLFPNQRVLKPLPNVNLVSYNDILILQKMENQIPDTAKILIPNSEPSYYFGIDGGAWIDVVTHHQAIRKRYGLDLGSPAIFRELCSTGVEFVFVGDTPYSFTNHEIEQRSQWYKLYFSYPGVKLYKIIGCQ